MNLNRYFKRAVRRHYRKGRTVSVDSFAATFCTPDDVYGVDRTPPDQQWKWSIYDAGPAKDPTAPTIKTELSAEEMDADAVVVPDSGYPGQMITAHVTRNGYVFPVDMFHSDGTPILTNRPGSPVSMFPEGMAEYIRIQIGGEPLYVRVGDLFSLDDGAEFSIDYREIAAHGIKAVVPTHYRPGRTNWTILREVPKEGAFYMVWMGKDPDSTFTARHSIEPPKQPQEKPMRKPSEKNTTGLVLQEWPKQCPICGVKRERVNGSSPMQHGFQQESGLLLLHCCLCRADYDMIPVHEQRSDDGKPARLWLLASFVGIR